MPFLLFPSSAGSRRARVGAVPLRRGPRIAAVCGCLFTLLAFAAAAASAAPNVLFIITDEQCADALSARMGDRYLKTPAMDSLVARGTYFSRAYAANPLCIPSRNSMFTGRYPHETGITDNTPMRTGEKLDPSRFPSLGTYFRRAGYQTAYFGKWHLCYDQAAPDTHGFEVTDGQQLDAVTADHAVDFLRRKHDRPFLLVTSFLNPHNVCELARGQPLSNGAVGEPPESGELPPAPPNLAPPAGEPDSMALMREAYHASPLFPVANFTPDDWRRLRWGYYRMIEKVDAEIGRVLAALRAQGLDKDTVVVFVSDHGEAAGAHGLNQKTVLYEEVARVPLIVCRPDGTRADTSDRLVNTGVDLLPTLLDFAGIAAPAALPGRSLRPLVEGSPVQWPDQVVVENNMTQGGMVDGFLPMTQGRMVRTDRFKYSVYEFGGQRESLIDLQRDPGELHDLARDPAYHDVLLEHRERLRRFGAATGDPLVATILADDVGPRPFPHVTKPKANWPRPAPAGDREPPGRGPDRKSASLDAAPRRAPAGTETIERPAFVYQSTPKRLDPFAASRLQLNPPTFRWPEVPGTTQYRLEFARRPDFADARAVTVAGLFYRPTEPLEPGTWYWRGRAEVPHVEPWLRAESFAISATLPKWPLPSWDELMNRIPRSHPRIYVDARGLEQIRANARRLAPEFAAWKQKVRAALEQPFDLETYARRVPPDADPMKRDTPALKKLIWAARAAAQQAAYPPADGAWIWAASGDPWFREAARRRALQAADLDPNGLISERNSGSDAGNLDFSNAAVVASLGEIYDLMFDVLSDEDRRRIRASIVARATPMFAKLARAPLSLMRGHGWQHAFIDGLVGAVAICDEEPVAREWVELGLKSFVALYPWFGGDDGGSQEGPRYFHAEEMFGSLDVVDVFRSVFSLRLEDGNPWYRESPYYLIYSFPPGGKMAKVGDVDRGVPLDPDDRLSPGPKARLGAWHMAQVYGNGHAAAYAAAVRDEAETPAARDPVQGGISLSRWLRWSNPLAVQPQPLAGLPAARAFTDVGTVFTHSHLTDPTADVRLVFHSSPYGGHGHSHADQNSFHLFAYDEELLLDSGYYTPTGDPHRTKWSVQTRAHNTILVDGVGQPWGDTTGYGELSHFEQHDGWVYFVGRAATAYPGHRLERFDRHVVWLRGGAVESYLIIDDLAAGDGKPHQIDWLLHAAREMAVDEARQTVRISGAKSEAQVRFLQPQPLRFSQDNAFDAPATYWRNDRNFPLPDQWHLKATAHADPDLRYVALIQVSRPGVEQPEPRALDNAVEVGRWRVRWAGAPLHVTVESVR